MTDLHYYNKSELTITLTDQFSLLSPQNDPYFVSDSRILPTAMKTNNI